MVWYVQSFFSQIDAFSVDNDAFDISQKAEPVGLHFCVVQVQKNSWAASESELLFSSLVLPLQNSFFRLLDGSDIFLRCLKGYMVDIGTIVSVVHSIRPPDSICFLYSFLTSLLSQFLLKFVTSKRHEKFFWNSLFGLFLWFSKRFTNLLILEETCCTERKGKFNFVLNYWASCEIVLIWLAQVLM